MGMVRRLRRPALRSLPVTHKEGRVNRSQQGQKDERLSWAWVWGS